MPATHEFQLVNTIGHSAGAILFGIFLVLLIRDRPSAPWRESWKSIAAASLAFLWNLGSLAVLVVSNSANSEPYILVAVTFSILSFLPAVLFDISLDGELPPLVVAGYTLSSVAVLLHFARLWPDHADERHAALLLITVGFAVLTLLALIGLAFRSGQDKRSKTSRMLAAMCSALFAMSFVHLGSEHAAQAWSKELALHHAGIPLALFVLLQDYRFMLLDAFIRFLANVLLATVLTFGLIRATSGFVQVGGTVANNPLYQALILVALCLLLIAFAMLRNSLQHWLTLVVFRRPDIDQALRNLQSGSSAAKGESEYIDWAAKEVCTFMSANRVQVLDRPALLDNFPLDDPDFPTPITDLPRLRNRSQLYWVEVLVPVRVSTEELLYIALGRRRGGRRYLSEDVKALARLSSAISEQIERFRRSEMQRLVSQAELRALQSQINPHFLFNALNTLYGIIPREASGARRTVLNLAEIFRYTLQTDKTLIALSEELEIVRAYLEIEKLRLGPRLQTEIDVEDAALAVPVPILSIQPLVENAIKHGLSLNPKAGWLRLQVKVIEDEVRIRIEDTGPGAATLSDQRSGGGVGLANVTKRLRLCFGPSVGLRMESGSEGTLVQFSVPLNGSISR
jgi:signal transduction histidine kinase